MGKYKKSRNWCLTINNYKLSDVLHFDELEKSGLIRYYVLGLEVGKEGTPHIQAYIETPSPIALTGAKKLWSTAHFEERYASQQQAIDYCKKDGQFKEAGVKAMGNGCRRDWIEINKNIINGDSILTQINKGYGSLQNIQHMEKLSKYLEKKRNWQPEVIWIYGKGGSGKSKIAYDADPDLFTVPCFKWWDGYDCHKTILIDDYRPEWSSFCDLLKVLDRYPYQVAIKGGFRQLLAKTIYITTQLSPEETWECKTGEDLFQLTRRITKVICTSQATPK